MAGEPLRFTEILTTAAAVASFLGDSEVRPRHVALAVQVLRGELRFEDLGRPSSPLGRGSRSPAVHVGLRETVQRWFTELGSDPFAELGDDGITRFLAELAALEHA